MSKGKDVVVCLPGARIEHVTERAGQIMGRGNGGSILLQIGTNNADKEVTTAIVEKYRSVWKQDPKIQEFEADGSQRDGEAALRGSGIRGLVGQLFG